MKKENSLDIVEKIYNDIKVDILKKEYARGDRLIETRMAKDYSCSRIHVRQAFYKLEGEHLIKHYPQKGFVVIGISNDDLVEIFYLRKALEEVIIRNVIKLATKEEIEEISRIAKRIKVFHDNDMEIDLFEEFDIFYNKIYKISNFKRISNILNLYSEYFNALRKANIGSKNIRNENINNILKLVEAIKQRDFDKASESIRSRVLHI